MKTHEEIMKSFWLFCKEIERRENFKKKASSIIHDYEYYKVRNILDLDDKSQHILKDELVSMARESVKKTFIYELLEKKETDNLLTKIQDKNFQYQLYYIDKYNNLITDITSKYYDPDYQVYEILKILIEKGMKQSFVQTNEVLEYIKKWDKEWESFIDKQILFYKLHSTMKEKNSKNVVNKI